MSVTVGESGQSHFQCRLLASLVFVLCLLSETAVGDEIRVGVLAHRGEEVARAQWSLLADYLSTQMPEHQFTLVPLDLEGMRAAVTRQRVRFIITNPGNYVALQAVYGVTRLATLQRLGEGEALDSFGAVILTRSDRNDILTLSDLKDRSFMAVHREAFGGFQFAWMELKRAGIDVQHDLRELRYSGFPQDRVVYAVRDGVVDAGTVRAETFVELVQEGRIDPSEFRILNPQAVFGVGLPLSTPLYPEWPFSAVPDTPHELAKRVALALLALKADHPAARAARISGWTVPVDYQPVHNLLRELGVEPYVKVDRDSLAHVLSEHWQWLAIAVAVAVALFARSMRIKRLVVARTKELAESNRALRRENQVRKDAEQALRESQRTFGTLVGNLPGMAYRSLIDRNWTMQYVSEGVLALTGYEAADLIGNERIAYGKVIAPEDRDRVWEEVQAALRQHATYQIDYRIRTAGGEERWVWEQGCGVLADGEHLLEGYIFDITDYKRSQDALQSILQSTAATVGQEFFYDLVQQLTHVLQVRYAFILEVVNPERVKVLAFWDGKDYGENIEYDIHDTPCEQSAEQGLAFFPVGVRRLFPNDSWLEKYRVESYLALPLLDRDGAPLGYMGVMHVGPMATDMPAEPLLKVFSVRASAELARMCAERERARLSNHVRLLLDATDEGIYGVDTSGRCTFINRAAARKLGYAPVELLGKDLHELTHHHRANGDVHLPGDCPVQQVLVDGNGCRIDDDVFWRRDGSQFPIEYSAYPVRENDAISGAVVVFVDVTERHEAQASLRKSESTLARAQRIARVGNWEWELASDVVSCSEEIWRISGIPPRDEAPTSKTLLQRVHPEDRERVEQAYDEAIEEHQGLNLEYRIVRPDGGERVVHVKGEVSYAMDGEPQRIVGTMQDITVRKRFEERLNYLAYYDDLTGLPNRVLFYDRLRQSLFEAARHQRQVAVMFMDLDRFKAINDTLGHEMGDALLREVAQRLARCIREGDTLARLGGDEFTVVLNEVAHVQDAARVAQKILSACQQPFDVLGRPLHISTSIGITLYPSDARDVQGLLKNADTAMYHAKEKGRNNYQFYSSDMTLAALERLTLETSLRSALQRGELVLHYQPQFNLHDGAIVGVEALLRWRHADLGWVAPSKFIPVAEETGLIGALDGWVLRNACTALRQWSGDATKGETQGEGLRMAINLSGRELMHLPLVADISRLLHELELPPDHLELEFTESALLRDSELTLGTLHELKSMGVRIVLDDFGTGFSSLGYLKRFPFDVLKIDRSYVRDLSGDGDAAMLTAAVIKMGHSLGMEVVAEGVETVEQWEFLREQGCDRAQGNYLGQPLTASNLVKALQEGGLDKAARSTGELAS